MLEKNRKKMETIEKKKDKRTKNFENNLRKR